MGDVKCWGGAAHTRRACTYTIVAGPSPRKMLIGTRSTCSLGLHVQRALGGRWWWRSVLVGSLGLWHSSVMTPHTPFCGLLDPMCVARIVCRDGSGPEL